MLRGKTFVSCRVPILCCDDQIEEWLEPISEGIDLVSFGDRQSATRKKIVLQIDENEGFHTKIKKEARLSIWKLEKVGWHLVREPHAIVREVKEVTFAMHIGRAHFQDGRFAVALSDCGSGS